MKNLEKYICSQCHGTQFDIVSIQSLHYVLKCNNCGYLQHEKPEDVECMESCNSQDHSMDGLDPCEKLIE